MTTTVTLAQTMDARAARIMKRKAFDEVLNEVWAFVLGYYQDKGYMPTGIEIAERFTNRQTGKKKTRQWAWFCLAELERRGKIKIIKNKHRGIQLI